MATEWKAQIGEGKYSLQFETDTYEFYRIVEKACQHAIDINNKRRKLANENPCARRPESSKKV